MEFYQCLDQFLLCGLLGKIHEHRCRMPIQNRHTDTLGRDQRSFRLFNLSIHYRSKDTKRLLLALFFLSTDIRNDVMFHLRPLGKSLACSRNRLIGRSYYKCRLKLLPCRQRRGITLNRAIWLNNDKASLRPKTFLLALDHLQMLRIDLRYHHRYIRSPAVCAVVGNHRRLRLGICLFYITDLFLCHVNRTEHKIHCTADLFHIIYIFNDNILYCFWHRCLHFPTTAHCIFIGFSCASRTGCNRRHLKPGMIFQK